MESKEILHCPSNKYMNMYRLWNCGVEVESFELSSLNEKHIIRDGEKTFHIVN